MITLNINIIFLIILLIVIIVLPYIWLFNCSYYLKEINKKLDKLLKK